LTIETTFSTFSARSSAYHFTNTHVISSATTTCPRNNRLRSWPL
jgi:hypothetical protein